MPIIGRKIIVLGCSGSGKSTFAKKPHSVTGLPLIHLDNIWWNSDRTHISREDFDKRIDDIFREDAYPENLLEGGGEISLTVGEHTNFTK